MWLRAIASARCNAGTKSCTKSVAGRWLRHLTPDLSLVVPLSHLLGLPVSAVKRTYLSEHGAPLVVDGHYADTDTTG